jgi:large subunit ribosomal protein L1
VPKRGKRYMQAKSEIDTERVYHPLHAVRLIKSQELTRFDPTVEVHLRLGVNVRHADQQLRGTISLPHGTGKSVTVAVFAEGDKAREAETAGADIVGGEDLAKRVLEGFDEFDVAIATPDMMGTVGKLGRILGPSGKMPNPKSGTVTFDVGKAVTDVKGGKVEYRTDRAGIIHIGIGRRSFEERQLLENYGVVIEEIVRMKPAAAKGRYLKSITIAQTMGPGIPLDTTQTSSADVLEEPA